MLITGVVLFFLLLGWLDFFGWVLRGLAEVIPDKPDPEYTAEEVSGYRQLIGELESENAILREIITRQQNELGIVEGDLDVGFDLVTGQVIYHDHARLFETALINRGTIDGIQIGMPVIDTNGLVGRVVSTRTAVSRIELITSPECSIGVLDQRSRELGVTRGSNPIKWQRSDGLGFDGEPLPPDILELEYLSPTADISTGDVLVTSGLSGITPRGIRVGQVVDIYTVEEQDWYNIRIEPFSDLEHLDSIAVILFEEEHKDEVDSLLDESIFGPFQEVPE